jgi:hypothetical protein
MRASRDHAARARKTETEAAIEESKIEHAAGVATVRGDVLASRQQP